MDIKSLKHAIVLSETGSFIRAAEKLSLSQSAVSRSILALEESLGTELFDRTSNGVFLTPAGNYLIERAKLIVSSTETLKRDIKLARQDISGDLYFGAVPALAVDCLPRLIADCFSRVSALQFRPLIRDNTELAEALRDERIEFFLRIDDNTATEAGFNTRTVGTINSGGIFARPDHPLTLCQRGTEKNPPTARVTGEQALAYPLVSASTYKALNRYHHQLLNLDPEVEIELSLVCDNLQVLIRTVKQSNALLITSQSAMTDLINKGELVEIPISNCPPPEQVNIDIVSLKGRSLSAPAALFVERLSELVKA